jgi:hypothetical protein
MSRLWSRLVEKLAENNADVHEAVEAEGVPMNQSLFDMTPKELRRAVRFWARFFAYAKAQARGFDDRWSELYAEFAWKLFKKQAIRFLLVREFERQREAAQWN